MKTAVALAIVCMGLRLDAAAQERVPDAVYATGEADSNGASSGGRGEAEWDHRLSPTAGIGAGGGSTSFAGVRWTYGIASAFVRRRGAAYAGRLYAGAGSDPATRFSFTRYVATATVPIARPWYAEAETQYARILGRGTASVKVGTLYAGISKVTIRAAYYAVWTSTARADSVSGAGEVTLGRVAVLGGAATAATGPRSPLFTASTVVIRPPTEYFVGAAVPVGRARLIGSAEIVPQPSGQMVRITTTLKLPLAASRRSTSKGSE